MRAPLALSSLLMLAACAAPPSPRPPAPEPTRTTFAVPRAAPAVTAPLAEDWRDWPQTAGDWRYLRDGAYSSASYGSGQDFAVDLVCDRDRRTISLALPAGAATPITIRTSSATRTISTVLRSASGVIPPATAQADVAASDQLLDAIAFSRGRFVVEQQGHPPLVLPAWAEVERVVEDCRG